MAEHRQVPVYCPLIDEEILIDKGIADLMRLIWSFDLETFNSCQDSFGTVWIEFEQGSFELLMKLIYAEDKELFDKLENWTYKVFTEGEIDPYRSHVHDTGTELIFSTSLRFPIENKRVFTKRLDKLLKPYIDDKKEETFV